MSKENSLLKNITIIVIGLSILLFGMNVVSFFTTDIIASYIDIIPLTIATLFIAKMINLDKLLGRHYSIIFSLSIALMAFLSLLYSTEFVFTLSSTNAISNHIEHNWAYEQIKIISNFSIQDWTSGALADLHIDKYANMFAYTSLMFIFGGDVVTHFCIFTTFNLGLQALLMVLIALKLGVNNKKILSLILVVCLLQPMLDATFAYGRDITGQASLALGFYIFICTYKNNFSRLIAFPIYAYLFYSHRVQYTIIAAMLFLWSLFQGKRNAKNIIIGLAVIFVVLYVFVSSIDWLSFIEGDLDVGSYEETSARQGRGLFNMLLLGTIGYFPWTNLISDSNWTYHIFACFQGAMNLTMIYYIVYLYRKRINAFYTNPSLFAGLMFLSFALYVPGHMAYTAVSMPFLAVGLYGISKQQFFKTYGLTIMIIAVVGLAYNLLGFGGRSFL